MQEFLHSPIYPVMVVSYEMAVRYSEDLHKIKFDLMVCDEAHRLKSNTIKTTSVSYRVIEYIVKMYVYHQGKTADI